MNLISGTDLLEQFEVHLSSAKQIDIAVAWVGPSSALNSLRHATQKRNIRVRVIVGLSGNATNPDALRSLQEFAEVRIAHANTGIFHPKFYLFRNKRTSTCWVGSANFTLSGFTLNSELVHRFSDDGSAARWFDELWRSLERNPDTIINDYAANWRRPPTPKRGKQQHRGRGLTVGDPLRLLQRTPQTWNDYIQALRACDAYWQGQDEHFSVLAPEWSWIETISAGGDLIRRNNWNNFTEEELNILLAFRNGHGAWGLLGTMKGAGKAVGSFITNRRGVRERIRDVMASVIEATTETAFITASNSAIEKVTTMHGFGPGIATRFIALARPDRGVSVNGGSAPGLGNLAGLPTTVSALSNKRNYPQLLRWVYEQPWYSVRKPDGSFQRTIWSMRAALVDSFVYHPV